MDATAAGNANYNASAALTLGLTINKGESVRRLRGSPLCARRRHVDAHNRRGTPATAADCGV